MSDFSLLTLQHRLAVLGFDPGPLDGLWGPKTLRAVMGFQKSQGLVVDGKIGQKTLQRLFPERSPWPKQKDVLAFFGKPGENLAKLTLPYPMRLAWAPEQTILKITLHKKILESAERAFVAIAQAYDAQARRETGIDLFGGSYANRTMRGKRTLSMHAWGLAIDFDPQRNQLPWGKDKARLAKPDCRPFWEAFEQEGWVSLGRAKNFDWMHVQAATL